MKTVTSEDNLAGYVDRRHAELIDPASLNRKIKSIKSALKVSERHNQDLHLKIKALREGHQLELLHLENQCRKHRQLYDMLAINYDLRGLELKECRKRLKKALRQGPHVSEEAEETGREYREVILKQEKEMGRLREENRLLYDQLYEKATRVKDLEQRTRSRSKDHKDHKDKNFLFHLRNALEAKNQEFQRAQQQKQHLSAAKASLERENAELALSCAKLSTEVEFERKGASEARERTARVEKEKARMAEQLRSVSSKYSELLGFSYELQKDFERDLQAAMKELAPKQQ